MRSCIRIVRRVFAVTFATSTSSVRSARRTDCTSTLFLIGVGVAIVARYTVFDAVLLKCEKIPWRCSPMNESRIHVVHAARLSTVSAAHYESTCHGSSIPRLSYARCLVCRHQTSKILAQTCRPKKLVRADVRRQQRCLLRPPQSRRIVGELPLPLLFLTLDSGGACQRRCSNHLVLLFL